MLAPVEGSAGGSPAGYTLVGVTRGFRPGPNNTLTQVVTLSATSNLYGVYYSFTILGSTWEAEGGPAALTTKTSEVNTVCGDPHVVDFRTEQDQGPSDVLYNYAVITVGTADKQIIDEVRVRMDQLATGGTQAEIDAAWARLVAAGAS